MEVYARGANAALFLNGKMIGKACPYNASGYLHHTTDTYYGEALAIIRPGEGEEIRIQADDGKYRAETVVQITGDGD